MQNANDAAPFFFLLVFLLPLSFTRDAWLTSHPSPALAVALAQFCLALSFPSSAAPLAARQILPGPWHSTPIPRQRSRNFHQCVSLSAVALVKFHLASLFPSSSPAVALAKFDQSLTPPAVALANFSLCLFPSRSAREFFFRHPGSPPYPAVALAHFFFGPLALHPIPR